jgi:hypothetical protein
MNLNDLNLLESLRADEAAGTLHFKKQRVVLLDANFLGLLRKKLVTVYGLPEESEMTSKFDGCYAGCASARRRKPPEFRRGDLRLMKPAR